MSGYRVRLEHEPSRDYTGVLVGRTSEDRDTPIDRVTFCLPDPADEHEASLQLTLSRAAWEAQGSPEEITLEMSA